MLGWILIDWPAARIQAYKDFYANYDAEKDFQRMKASSTYKYNLFSKWGQALKDNSDRLSAKN